ncbi:MAG: hypothetical protein ABID87_01055 [Chloroflexota bacterium]
MLKKLIGLAVFVVIVIIIGFVFFNLPQRIGLAQTPTEKLISATPDREAAAAMMADLKVAGTDTAGIELYIFPVIGDEDSPSDDNVAVVIIDEGKGFDFRNFNEQDLMNYMEKLSSVGQSGGYNIERVAISYSDKSGDSLITLTASTEAILKFANGTTTREQFLEEMEGEVNIAEVAKKIAEMAK